MEAAAARYLRQVEEEGRATGTFDLLTAEGDHLTHEFEAFAVDHGESTFRVGLARPAGEPDGRRPREPDR
jgi:hypothetical protein